MHSIPPYKPSFSTTYAKHWLICSFIALLAACGSQEGINTDTAGTNNALTATKSIVNSENNTDASAKDTNSTLLSTLLASLAQLYPNGQLPTERAAQAAQDLAQNPTALLLTSAAASRATEQQPSLSLDPLALSTDYQPVKRVQNTTLYGAYFFSIYPTEITTALATNPNWSLEGPAFWASLATGTDLYPVHRFRNKTNGSYLYSIYETERVDIATNYAATFEYEGVAWYARQTPATGWSALYRFRNKTNGTYLFSAYESEKNAIVTNYPDVFALEGIAYYVRQDAQADPVVPIITLPAAVTAITPTTAGRGIATTFTVTGTSLPLTAVLTVQGATCLAPTGNTNTGFSQVCTLSGTTGTRSLSVDSATGGSVIDNSRSVFVPVLPDTGITSSQCYKAGSNILSSCAFSVLAGTAYDLNSQQDGMVGLDKTAPAAADGKLGFSFSEVSNPAGGNFPKADCIKDNLTGLVWEVKTNLGLRDGRIKYTNYDSTTTLQKSDGAGGYIAPTLAQVNEAFNSIGYKNAVNASSLCGYTDWRLPTPNEVISIMDFGVAFPGPAVDPVWLPNVSSGFVWAATPSYLSPQSVWLGSFNYGGVYLDSSRDISQAIVLVRGTTVSSQYIISANGQEVTDSQTGLIWRRCSEGQTWSGSACTGFASSYTHEAALAQTTAQTLATNVAWRLPNFKELSSIANRANANPSIDTSAFPSTPSARFWSSTPYTTGTPEISDPYYAKYVDFSNGTGYGAYRRSFMHNIRLVRSSP
jgi:Protein of unknown function (DUF1566)/Repeat of unknown function (DUF5648)